MKFIVVALLLLSASISSAENLEYERDRSIEWSETNTLHYQAVKLRLESNHVDTDGLEMYPIIDQRTDLQKTSDQANGISKFPYYIRVEEGGMVLRCKVEVSTKVNLPDQIIEANVGLCKIQMLN